MNCTQQDFYIEARDYVLSNTADMLIGGYSISSQGTSLLKVFLAVSAAQSGSSQGNLNSFYSFVGSIWSQYSNSANPCNFLLNRYNHFNNQLSNNTYSLAQTLLKTAKRDYFAHMYNFCGCGTVPPVAPPPPAPNPPTQGAPTILPDERYDEGL